MVDPEFQKAMQRNPHLKEYLVKFNRETGTLPEFVVTIPKDIDREDVNILIPVGDPVFIHLYGTPEMGEVEYRAVEPQLSKAEEKKYDIIMDLILEKAAKETLPESEAELKELIMKLFNDSTEIGGFEVEKEDNKLRPIIEKLFPPQNKVPVNDTEYNQLLYHIERNIIGSGPIEPVIRDPYLEDIHSIGVNNVFIVHKILDMLKTNISFGDEVRLDNWLRSMSERIGRPVSDSKPIADGALPDGSRINIIYSPDISRRGSSFTMRKFSEVPISIIQLISWGAINYEMGAYMWMCLENGMSIFFSGETASGKTTMLNACLCFVNPKSKVYSAEDTAEVQPPQPVWQQLITREDGPPDSRVDTFTLLKAALRSRPNYIIVGEIRGAEGAVAFQAMQCVRNGYIAVPDQGPVNIRDLYESNSSTAQRNDGKYVIDLIGQEIPVYTSGPDGKIMLSTITNVYKMDMQDLLDIRFDTGERLEVTPNHRFLLEGGTEIEAKELLNSNNYPTAILPPPINWSNNDQITVLDLVESNDIDIESVDEMVVNVKDDRGNLVNLPVNISESALRSIAHYILGIRENISEKDMVLIEDIMGFDKTHVPKPFWNFGYSQLEIILRELQELTQTSTISVSDRIWYYIGRLNSTDSIQYIDNDIVWRVGCNEDHGSSKEELKRDILETIPNTSGTVHEHIDEDTDKLYLDLKYIDRSFIDWLTKSGFILIKEDECSCNVRVPSLDCIKNLNGYIAGLLDSDITDISYCGTNSFNVTMEFGLNHHDDKKELLDKLNILTSLEHDMVPQIDRILVEYIEEYTDFVSSISKYCTDKGYDVVKEVQSGFGSLSVTINFSSNTKQDVWNRWMESVIPYMHSRDKVDVLRTFMGIVPNLNENDTFEIETYTCSVHKEILPDLSMLARIFGYTLVSEDNGWYTEKYFTFKQLDTARIVHVEESVRDHTYDISMNDGSYYIGGNVMTSYVYDTGHPVVATFHASAVKKMIQRLTGEPINVPVTFVDNLNVAMILQAVYRNGKFLRRCISIEEIEGYYEEAGGVVTRAVFQWDPETDTHKFRGLNNSFILEDKIATILGYEDKRKIYDDLFLRAKILEEMHNHGIEDYHEVHDILVEFYKHGVDGLPFMV